MNRAYAVLELKTVDEEKRILTGIASTPSPDTMGDVVEPKGAEFKLPIPFLWQHNSSQPIGHVMKAKVTAKGIEVEVHIAKTDEPGALKTRLDEAWQSIKLGLVRGMSIGFSPTESARIEGTYGRRFLKWLWLELSAVTIPANQEASITAIKAASGQSNRPRQGTQTKGNTMKQFTQEALAALQSDRQTKAARLAELLETKGDGGFADDARAEFTTLRGEVADLDDEIAVCEVHIGNIAKAKPVEQRSGGGILVRKFKDVEPQFKGEEGVKRFVAKTIATIDARNGVYRNPSAVAEQLYGKTNPTLVAVMKANEVPGAGSGSGEAMAELVSADNRFSGDFVDYLYAETVFDKLPLMSVPANVGIKGIDGAYTGYWVGESKPIPMSQGSASNVATLPLKVGGLTVLSNELIRDSSPAALGIVGQALREALSQVVDTKFFSTDAASAGVSPAGILNGLSAITSNGGDAQSVTTDLKALFAPFVTAKNVKGSFAWVMTPTTAIALSLMKNALGQPEYPTINGNGGTLLGYPVFVGDNIGSGDVILLKPSQIWKIGDRGVDLSVSTEAMIEQSSAPTGATDTPVAASQAFTSMFQEESTAIKVVRSINWGKKYTSAAAYVGDAAWGSEQS